MKECIQHRSWGEGEESHNISMCVSFRMTKEIYLDWFKQFIKWIAPARPVLLIQDGHASHVSIDLIELARANCNDIHLLCLSPQHYPHTPATRLGVFKSFKSAFSQACHRYVMQQPGRVVTADVLVSLVGEAWPRSFNPVKIMSGFRKCGSNHSIQAKWETELYPSKGVTAVPVEEAKEDSPPFSPEKVELFEKRFEEGYDVLMILSTGCG